MTSSTLDFRRGSPADAAALAKFAERTFRETFGHSTTAEDMDAHAARSYGVEHQARELADPESITLIHERDGAIAAFVQVRRRPAPEFVADRGLIELQRFYVDSPYHGQGIAPAMMDQAAAAARELGGSGLWLSVWQENARAIAFYRKCGYTIAGSADFWVGPDRQSDYIMVMDLKR